MTADTKKPKVNEFLIFITCLRRNAPNGYKPWLFRLEPQSKAPLKDVSWKAKHSQLSVKKAVEWLRKGGNIGIAGMKNDPLVNIDLDGENVQKETLKPTLTTRSRSRTGIHGFYFTAEKEKIGNIPTDDDGEVRCDGQYVVAAGSYVPPDDACRKCNSKVEYKRIYKCEICGIIPRKQVNKEGDTCRKCNSKVEYKRIYKCEICGIIPEKQVNKECFFPEEYRNTAGYYTVEDKRSPAWIKFDEIPEVFRKIVEENEQETKKRKTRKWTPQKKANGKQSALFNIEARDVVTCEGGDTKPSKRWGSLFHGSKTDANMSLSKQGLLQCWRHYVSHNGLQALVVLSGYMTCRQAGSPHKDSRAGPSAMIGDDGAIFHAWLYAKNNGYIPIDDPIPVRAMHYIAKKQGLHKPKRDELLPKWVYKRVLEIVKEEY